MGLRHRGLWVFSNPQPLPMKTHGQGCGLPVVFPINVGQHCSSFLFYSLYSTAQPLPKQSRANTNNQWPREPTLSYSDSVCLHFLLIYVMDKLLILFFIFCSFYFLLVMTFLYVKQERMKVLSFLTFSMSAVYNNLNSSRTCTLQFSHLARAVLGTSMPTANSSHIKNDDADGQCLWQFTFLKHQFLRQSGQNTVIQSHIFSPVLAVQMQLHISWMANGVQTNQERYGASISRPSNCTKINPDRFVYSPSLHFSIMTKMFFSPVINRENPMNVFECFVEV